MTPFGERLLAAAKYIGLPQKQSAIARHLGFTRQTVNYWFVAGEPSGEHLVSIKTKWGVSPEWLLTGKGDMLPSPPDNLSSEEKELVKSYRMAAPDVRKLIRGMARAARKAFVAVVASIPPFFAPQQGETAVLHNYSCAAIVHIVANFLKQVLHLHRIVKDLGITRFASP